MAAARALLSQGWEAHRAGDLPRARAAYLQALRACPDDGDALCLLGLLAGQAGRGEEAVAHLRRAATLEPARAAFAYFLATAHLATGQLRDAEAVWRKAIECARTGPTSGDDPALPPPVTFRPDPAELHNNLGVTLARQDGHEAAVAEYDHALALRPDYAEALNNRGNALRLCGRAQEALADLRQALRLEPDAPDTHNDLGVALEHLGALDEAKAAFRHVLSLKPDHVDALNNLGLVLKRHGKHDEAVATFRRALDVQPDSAQVHSNLGVVLALQGKPEEASAALRQALAANPSSADALNNLGNVLCEQSHYEEGIASLRKALEVRPKFPDALNNLGNALRVLGETDEAIECYHQALALRPDFADAHSNLGIAFFQKRQMEWALASYERALELNPAHAEAHLNRSQAWLALGRWRDGWPEYEWRWQIKEVTPRGFAQPRWNGSPAGGRTVLLYAEQGLGDTLQFVRYAPLVQERGARVVLECPPPLAPLLSRCPGIDQLVPQGTPLPDFDVQVPLLSLPGVLGTDAPDLAPADVPYLFGDPARSEPWRRRLAAEPGYKIGIGWQGSPRYRGDRHRSIPLRYYAALAEVPGVRLYSLQKGFGTEQLREVGDRFPLEDLGSKLDEGAGAFVDTAAVVSQLDLVVTSDTALAHLAGGLGAPVWVALPFAADWRWLLHREDCPWYPTMRLFRQDCPGRWENVFARIADELTSLARKGQEKPGGR